MLRENNRALQVSVQESSYSRMSNKTIYFLVWATDQYVRQTPQGNKYKQVPLEINGDFGFCFLECGVVIN